MSRRGIAFHNLRFEWPEMSITLIEAKPGSTQRIKISLDAL